MFVLKIFRFVGAALLISIACAATAHADSLTLDLDDNFGEGDPSGTLSMSFESTTPGTVTVTLSTVGWDTGSTEHVKAWYFNFDNDGGFDAASTLTFSSVDDTTVTLSDAQDRQADGDGKYNIQIDFTGTPANETDGTPDTRFTAGETITFTITGAGITAADFDHLGAVGGGNGPFYSAAHIGGLGTGGEDSTWLGSNPVPEPSTLALLFLGLVGLVMVRRRRSRQTA